MWDLWGSGLVLRCLDPGVAGKVPLIIIIIIIIIDDDDDDYYH